MINRRSRAGSLLLTVLLWVGFAGLSLAADEARPDVTEPRAGELSSLAAIVEQAIAAGKCHGAVVLVGHQGKIIYRRAFGYGVLTPGKTPMTVDTIFDMASLTKVLATTPAVMQLVEQGRMRLADPVAEYWPEFKANSKEHITVRALLTHYSGLRPDLDLKPEWSGYETALKMIVEEKPVAPPGTRFIYSDISFETLGELVRRVSGEPLDVYCARHIFKPLGMKDTGFNPLQTRWQERPRMAPTLMEPGPEGTHLWGDVHDPTARNMGGVAGHAGVFSTADDLAIFAEMLLHGGAYGGVRVLSPQSVEKMTSPQSPPNKTAVRGLGWDIESPYSSARGELFPVGSFGHTGYTGPSIWIDPFSQTYVIVLTSRLYPAGKGDVTGLRARLATLVAAAVGAVPTEATPSKVRGLTSYQELIRSYGIEPPRNGSVQTGIDVLAAEKFTSLSGQRVGLITNQTGRDAAGRRTLELLAHAPGVKLVATFSPEHGLAGVEPEGTPVHHGAEPVTGLPVYSLYGETQRPNDAMLAGLDALVFDVQDVGVRFYTYITTLGYAMEAAAKKGIKFYVLDRPNPLNGYLVEGPVLDDDLRSFVGYAAMPVRHGLTVGELAEMYNGEQHLGVDLHVIKMRGWQRTDWFDETGLPWVNPSPNLHSLTAATLYPGVALVESANVSVGRGTDTPFEFVGAPWIDGKKLAAYLNERKIQGVRFLPVEFTPRRDPFGGQTCHGVRVLLLDRQALDSPEMGVEILTALYRLFSQTFQIDKTLPLVGSRWVLEAVKAGQDPRQIFLRWQDALEQFRRRRAKFLLY
jgi:uncharacterized protein YbbC (DUF1343 family)/CubicO group peptidase (beta-lactamase class C family)